MSERQAGRPEPEDFTCHVGECGLYPEQQMSLNDFE